MMDLNLLSHLMAPPPDQRGRIYGVKIGLVTNNQDPDKMGRVKVKFPWLSDQDESYWARVLSPMAGHQRGIYFLPEVNDEVLVAFDQGLIIYPYILGALWNGTDQPPISNDDGQNNKRLIKSRSGHTILLDDTASEEKIVIQDKTGKNEIILDAKTNTVTLSTSDQLILKATGKISMSSSQGDLEISCNNFKLVAQENCNIVANSRCQVKANAGLALDCNAGVKVNNGALEVL